jgi:hypothetical protein
MDNYVYTRESFEEARKLLTPDGTLVLAFAVTRGYVADRLFATLTSAFGVEPRAFPTESVVYGMVYVEGAAHNNPAPANVQDVTAEVDTSSRNALIATDNWPFLYLDSRHVPSSLCIALLVFVASLWLWQGDQIQNNSPADSVQFFLLGTGFLLLETRAVTQLALLFGTTWIVVTVVITSFLIMSFAANAFAMRFTLNLQVCYAALLIFLILSLVLPISRLAGLPLVIKVAGAGFGTAMPVLFSGLVFSSVLKSSFNASCALGINMLGSVIGGVLESSIMIGGIWLVGVLAVLAYAGAWLVSVKKIPEPSLALEVDSIPD